MEVLIYIPEDKVPKNLGGCSIEISFCGGHVCQVTMVDRCDEEGLYFTELPKGHLDLIAEPTEEEIAETIGGNNDFAECIRESVKAVFDNAKTIIPAEKDGD